jgi:NAD(P)-dependent dehydrogenase (short-subunit alcohol dehydrogenase family)
LTEKFLAGKTAFVTAASRNLGAVTAQTLAHYGADVAINYLENEAGAAQVVDAIRESGRQVYAIRGDLSKGSEVIAVTEQAAELLGGHIDILVNNAGPFAADPFATLAESEWDRIMNINVKASYLTAQVAIPGMRESGWGRIINLSAGSAYIRNHSVYGLAKSTVILLTEAMALELGPEITVNAIAPGQIAESGPDISAIDPTFVARAIANSPTGRLATRPEVAEIIAWLCSPAAESITGHTIPVDGGWRFNRF